MVDIDTNKDLQRIVDTMLADELIFDEGKTDEKLRSVKFGDPNAMLKKSEHMPYAYVTTQDAIQATQYGFGVSTNQIINFVSVEYEVVIVAKAQDKSLTSQKQLYELLKNVRNTLVNNPTFTTADRNAPPNTSFWTEIPEPAIFTEWITNTEYENGDNVNFEGKFYVAVTGHTSDDGDPIFSRSVISDIPYDSETRGELVTSISFTIFATIGTIGKIQTAGLGTIELLSEPPDREDDQYARHYDTFRRLKGVAPLGDSHVYFIEIESTTTSIEFFRAKKFDRKKFEINVTKSSGEIETYNVLVAVISRGITINSVPTAVITFEVVPWLEIIPI